MTFWANQPIINTIYIYIPFKYFATIFAFVKQTWTMKF